MHPSSDRIRNSVCGLVGYPDPLAQKICRGTRSGGNLEEAVLQAFRGISQRLFHPICPVL